MSFSRGECRKVDYCKPLLGFLRCLTGHLTAVGLQLYVPERNHHHIEEFRVVERCIAQCGRDLRLVRLSVQKEILMQRSELEAWDILVLERSESLCFCTASVSGLVGARH